MTYEYSEDNLIEQTAIDLFHNRLDWDTLLAFNSESFGESGTLGRMNKKEVVLKRILLGKLAEFNKEVEARIKLIFVLGEQNSKLRDARDILLPKLMSGQIEV